jgi:hypothetical protein
MPITRYSDPDASRSINMKRAAQAAATKKFISSGGAGTGGGYNYGTATTAGYKPQGATWAEANIPGFKDSTATDQAWALKDLYNSAYQASNTPQFPTMTQPGSGRSGGGGGGGAAGPTGLDQATLDWILAQLGRGKPQGLTANNLDLPDPSQYFGQYDTKPFDVARQGLTQGIQGIRDRGTTAIGNARSEIERYQNPYFAGLQSTTPDLQQTMQPMMQANGVNPGAVQATNNEGIQADQAMRNAMQMLAGTDQARQASNLRANTADLGDMNKNLDLEQLLLSLGVDMGQAKGQTAWDQMIKQAGFDTATQEAAQNWQRGNTVGDTNVTNNNAWNQGLISTLLSIIGSKAPGTTLPANVGAFA